jgi:hypothetical protein
LKTIALVLRIYSYIFQFILCLFLLGLAILTLSSGRHNLSLDMLPWTGAELTYWILALSITGLVVTLLAATGLFRYLFPLWCLFVVVMMIRGYFLSGYTYSGPDQFRSVTWLITGAIVAFLAALTLFRRRPNR